MKFLFSFCSVTGLKVSLYITGRFCQASPNRVEVIRPCDLIVVFYVPVLKRIELEFGVTPVPLLVKLQQRQE